MKQKQENNIEKKIKECESQILKRQSWYQTDLNNEKNEAYISSIIKCNHLADIKRIISEYQG